MRFVRDREWESGMYAVDVSRCTWCCEGNNVNTAKEWNAIQTFLRVKADLWHPLTDEEREQDMRDRLAAEKAQRDAYRANWLTRSRTVYPNMRAASAAPPLHRDDEAGSPPADVAAELAWIKQQRAAFFANKRKQVRVREERGR